MGVTGIVGLVSVPWFLRADSSSVLCCFFPQHRAGAAF